MVKQVGIDSVNLDITLGTTFNPPFTQSSILNTTVTLAIQVYI
jgi:hypothetical protein